MKDGQKFAINETGEKDEVLEGEFYKPTKKASTFIGGKSFYIELKNRTGIEHIFVSTGGNV